MARDLWLTLLAQAGRQQPFTVQRKLLDECAPEQVQQAKDLGVLGKPDLARYVADPRHGDSLLEVEFTDDGPVLHTPADSPETDVRVPREKLERYPVSLEALFAALAKTNKLSGKPRRLQCGAWLLGRRKSGGRARHVCLLPAGLHGPIRQLLREACDELNSAPLAVLLPPEHALDATTAGELRGRDILALVLEDRLEPDLRLDLEEVRAFTGADGEGEVVLQVDVSRREAWFGGVPLTMPFTALRVLDCLASRPQTYLSGDEIASVLGIEPKWTQQWIADRVKEIRGALRSAANGTDRDLPSPERVLQSGRNQGYALMLSPEQLSRTS